MKTKKLILALFTCFLLVSAVAVPAGAAEDAGVVMPRTVWNADRGSSYDMWPSYGKISYRPGPFDDCWGATTYFIDDHETYLSKKCEGKSYCKIWGENGSSTTASATTKNSSNDLYAQTPKVAGQWYARELLHSYVNYSVQTSGTANWRQDITVNTH